MILALLSAVSSVITRHTVEVSTLRAVEDGGDLCAKRTYLNCDSSNDDDSSSNDDDDDDSSSNNDSSTYRGRICT